MLFFIFFLLFLWGLIDVQLLILISNHHPTITNDAVLCLEINKPFPRFDPDIIMVTTATTSTTSVCVSICTPPAPVLEQQWRGDPAMVIMCWGLLFDWTKPQGLFPAPSNDSLLLLGLLFMDHFTLSLFLSLSLAPLLHLPCPNEKKHLWEKRKKRWDSRVTCLKLADTFKDKKGKIDGWMRNKCRRHWGNGKESIEKGLKVLVWTDKCHESLLTSEVSEMSVCIDSLLHWAHNSWLTEFFSFWKEHFFLSSLRMKLMF